MSKEDSTKQQREKQDVKLTKETMDKNCAFYVQMKTVQKLSECSYNEKKNVITKCWSCTAFGNHLISQTLCVHAYEGQNGFYGNDIILLV